LKVTKEDIMKYFGGFNYNGIKSRNWNLWLLEMCWNIWQLPRNKFKAIHKSFHMDNELIIQLLNAKIRIVYQPSNYVTVDETILHTKSRNPHRQHVRSKPKATGCKLFTLCDSNCVPMAF
jgi:hypothetical protein